MLRNESHRRLNILTGDWVLCSPHRAKRPWLGNSFLDSSLFGQQETVTDVQIPDYVSDCYLCPSNTRITGNTNPQYEYTHVFPNDFPAVMPDEPIFDLIQSKLLQSEPVKGECRVVCFSPKHNLTMAAMNINEIEQIIKTLIHEYNSLIELEYIKYVQMFENKGSVMGCSPHGQIWATGHIPNEPQKELNQIEKYRIENGSCLLCDYSKEEYKLKSRVVYENESFIAVVPFWAVWPYETLILSKSHIESFTDFNPITINDFSKVLKQITSIYDLLFSCSFPYSMGYHQGKGFHFHCHFYPPLLRSSTIKKFLVGYEMLAESQRDITPEQAAETLRSLIKNN